MNPGELRSRVTLQRQTRQDDGQGGYIVDYEDYAMVWAKFEALAAKTTDQYQQLTPEILYRATIRHRPSVLYTDRLQKGGRIFEQIGPPVNIDERNAYLRLECREVVNDDESDD